ncbi:hypothetical protein DN403_26200 [Bacillus sp. AY2-1]|nr:hypothetical protein DN403_26200 [Bacillus sp. AY2-1]
MNYFMMDKYQSIEENVLYSAKVLYSLLIKGKSIHIDELFELFAEKQGIILNINIERVLYLSMTFLYVTSLIDFNSNMIKRL